MGNVSDGGNVQRALQKKRNRGNRRRRRRERERAHLTGTRLSDSARSCSWIQQISARSQHRRCCCCCCCRTRSLRSIWAGRVGRGRGGGRPIGAFPSCSMALAYSCRIQRWVVCSFLFCSVLVCCFSKQPVMRGALAVACVSHLPGPSARPLLAVPRGQRS